MAAPVVAAIAALARTLNPDVARPTSSALLKETASRPPGSGWNPELGWGIVNAGAALNAAAAIDRRPPASKLRGPARVRGPRTSTLRWTGRDAARAKLRASGHRLLRGLPLHEPRALQAHQAHERASLRVRMRPGSRYRFYTVAVDRAGNREAVPAKPDLSTRVACRAR